MHEWVVRKSFDKSLFLSRVSFVKSKFPDGFIMRDQAGVAMKMAKTVAERDLDIQNVLGLCGTHVPDKQKKDGSDHHERTVHRRQTAFKSVLHWIDPTPRVFE